MRPPSSFSPPTYIVRGKVLFSQAYFTGLFTCGGGGGGGRRVSLLKSKGGGGGGVG